MMKNRQICLESFGEEKTSDIFNHFLLFSLSFPTGSQRRWYVYPRSIHWRQQLFSVQFFIDASFQQSFRMSRHSFFTLHSLVQPYIQRKQTHLRPTISSEHRLAIFLYHITQGVGYTTCSNLFAVGRSTVSMIVGEVSHAIVDHLSSIYVQFPGIDEATRTMEFFRAKSGIPGIVACIDGCHIPIIQPANSGTAYCNRKGIYSINVQGIRMALSSN
jgi:hypothetical protein